MKFANKLCKVLFFRVIMYQKQEFALPSAKNWSNDLRIETLDENLNAIWTPFQ